MKSNRRSSPPSSQPSTGMSSSGTKPSPMPSATGWFIMPTRSRWMANRLENSEESTRENQTKRRKKLDHDGHFYMNRGPASLRSDKGWPPSPKRVAGISEMRTQQVALAIIPYFIENLSFNRVC